MIELYKYKGTCIRVIDGDNLIASVSLGFDVYKDVNIRLAYINSPELSRDPVAGNAAKKHLETLALNKTIYFNSKKYDKYKRSIAEVFLTADGVKSINTIMLESGHANKVNY